jgi:hypothetical protein
MILDEPHSQSGNICVLLLELKLDTIEVWEIADRV